VTRTRRSRVSEVVESKQERASSGGSTGLAKSGSSESSPLESDGGKTAIADSVVSKIAGIATREVSGVHQMGAGAARALGAVRDKLPGVGGANAGVTQGVSVEVGERQAAIDLDIVTEYGVSIPDVADAVRHNVTERVTRMTGLEVTEINISVDDIYLGDEGSDEEPRVQ
jgi:uncharacterized alkaline shock family protein YloU